MSLTAKFLSSAPWYFPAGLPWDDVRTASVCYHLWCLLEWQGSSLCNFPPCFSIIQNLDRLRHLWFSRKRACIHIYVQICSKILGGLPDELFKYQPSQSFPLANKYMPLWRCQLGRDAGVFLCSLSVAAPLTFRDDNTFGFKKCFYFIILCI